MTARPSTSTEQSPSAAPRGGRLMTIGVVAVGLSVAGAGAAAAIAPNGTPSVVPTDVETSTAADGFTCDQYEAFWSAGYTWDDALALQALWDTDIIETKATAGQLLLDGKDLPIEPSGAPEDVLGC